MRGLRNLVCLALALGCGAHTLGVQSITFLMTPVATPGLPAFLDASVLATASGSVTVDVPGNRGILRVSNLPGLPQGASYAVMIHVAPDPRTWLPGAPTEGEAVGHSHGALSGVVAAPGHAAPPPDQVPIFVQPLAPSAMYPGLFETSFGAADLAPLPLGGVRGAMVILRSSDPAVGSLVLLVGDVAASPAQGAGAGASEPAGGHDHGA